ncbi:TetR/AcrR family transcriptional regulator [Actinocorallia aurea]
MGNREDLLAGAKRCLLDKGYGRTTARDITTAAGVSLAAIGYHFGSKEALLNEALREAVGEWADELAATLSAAVGAHADPAERFEAVWTDVLRSFAAHRALWTVQFEVVARFEGNPELRQAFTEADREARLGLVELFGLRVDPAVAENVGAYLQMLLGGAAAQWLGDPEGALPARELLTAIRAVHDALTP